MTTVVRGKPNKYRNMLTRAKQPFNHQRMFIGQSTHNCASRDPTRVFTACLGSPKPQATSGVSVAQWQSRKLLTFGSEVRSLSDTLWTHGVVVIIQDFESCDPSSNLGGSLGSIVDDVSDVSQRALCTQIILVSQIAGSIPAIYIFF